MNYKRFFVEFTIALALLAFVFAGWDGLPTPILLVAGLGFAFVIGRIVVTSWRAFLARPKS